MMPKQIFNLSKITWAYNWAGQGQPLGGYLAEVDLIALRKRVADGQDEHQPLAPTAALLKPFEGPAIQRKRDISTPVLHKTGGIRMGQLAHLNGGASSMMFEFKQ